MSRRRGEAPEGWPVLPAPWQYRDHDPAKDHQPKTDRHITRWQRMASEWIEEHIHDRRARSTARAIVIEAPTFLNDGESLANGEPALSFSVQQMAKRIGMSVDATNANLHRMCEPGGPLAIVWKGRAGWPTVYALAMAPQAGQGGAAAQQHAAARPAATARGPRQTATDGPSAAPRRTATSPTGRRATPAGPEGTTAHAHAMASRADRGVATARPEGAATAPPQRPRRATAAATAGPSAAPRRAVASPTGQRATATQAGPVAFDPNACLDTFTRGAALNQAWAEFCESARTMATPESQQVYAAGVIMGFTRDVPPVAMLTDRGAA